MVMGCPWLIGIPEMTYGFLVIFKDFTAENTGDIQLPGKDYLI
jgi:hypothetical protein